MLVKSADLNQIAIIFKEIFLLQYYYSQNNNRNQMQLFVHFIHSTHTVEGGWR